MCLHESIYCTYGLLKDLRMHPCHTRARVRKSQRANKDNRLSDFLMPGSPRASQPSSLLLLLLCTALNATG